MYRGKENMSNAVNLYIIYVVIIMKLSCYGEKKKEGKL